MSSGDVGGFASSIAAGLGGGGGGGVGGGGGRECDLPLPLLLLMRMTGTSTPPPPLLDRYLSLHFTRILALALVLVLEGMAISPWSVTRWPGGSRGG